MKDRIFQAKMIGLDLRQIEDIVDDREQMPAGLVDPIKPFALCLRDLAAAQQVRKPHDGVDRRADFMAHIGEKRAFRLACGLGTALCLL